MKCGKGYQDKSAWASPRHSGMKGPSSIKSIGLSMNINNFAIDGGVKMLHRDGALGVS